MPVPPEIASCSASRQGQDAGTDLLSGPAWSRHRLDLARAVLAGGALLVGVGVSRLRPGPARSVSVSLVDLVVRLPPWTRELLIGSTQILALLVPVAMVLLLVRNPRLLAMALGSALAAGVVMAGVQRHIEVAVPRRVELATTRQSWIFGAAFPSGAYLAGFTAVVIVLGPVLSRGWRRAAIGGLGLASLARIVTAVAVPLNVEITLALGAVIGSATLMALGSPRRTVRRGDVLEGLARAGLPITDLWPQPLGAGHGQTFLARTPVGATCFVKLLGRDERSADHLLRALRRLRVRGLEDDRPSWSPADVVDNEAFASLLAARRGVRVAPIMAVGSTAGGDGLLAAGLVAGSLLSDLPPPEITDQLLDDAWRQVLLLHDAGIAHRWFTPAHLIVEPAAVGREGDDGPAGRAVTILDLRWSVLRAGDHLLAADLASLVVGLALLVGPVRAVSSAVRVVPPDQLRDALPLVQPLALPEDVRSSLRHTGFNLAEVRKPLAAAIGGAGYELADIERIGPRHLAAVLGLVAITYSLLPLASSWSDIGDALGRVQPTEVPMLVALASLPYLIGAATIMAVVTRPLPYLEVVRLVAAQSFLNRFTPANAGGMTLRVGYLQKRGVTSGEAAAGMVLTAGASFLAQIVVIASMAGWAGSEGSIPFSLPKTSSITLVALGVALIIGLVWSTPVGRRAVIRPLRGTIADAWSSFLAILQQPARFLTLAGTTVLNKVAVILAFVACCRALEIDLAFATLGFLYVTASTVASAAPTPGGVGAVEAALTAALTGSGAPPAEALSAVFVFRFATYWLPVPFGWWALRHLHRHVLA